MLKNILKLDGAQSLSKTEQKTINGGSSKGSVCPGGVRPLWGLCNPVTGLQIGYCRGGLSITRFCR